MSKKTKIIVWLVVIVLVITGFVSFTITNKPAESNIVSLNIIECDNKLTLGEQSLCYSNIARQELDPSICNNDNEYPNSRCYMDAIRYINDPSLCEGIRDDAYRSDDRSYKDLCYRYVAQNNEEEAICEKIKNNNEKEVCYTSMAIRKVDSDICNLIDNQELVDECYLEYDSIIKDSTDS